MDIIIAGAGIVGYRLATTLSLIHNVYVIDKNQQALARLSESIDIMPILGDIEDPDTYKKLKSQFDIFIAVTDSDEANILSTLIAQDTIQTKSKIIRLRNPYFAKSSIADRLGITEAVFPFVTSAQSIGELLEFPKANNIKNFIFTPLKLISILLQQNSINNIDTLQEEGVEVVGIEREKNFFIPQAKESLKENDLVYLFGDENKIRQLCDRLNKNAPKKIKRVAIFGANLLGVEIAKIFAQKGIELKIIEKESELCKRASEIVQDRAVIINSTYIEHTLYENENLKNADMIIATSTKDETNIIRCLEAKEYHIAKTVAVNNDLEYYNLMHRLGIVAVRGPKSSAYYAILEKIGSSKVVIERHFCGGRGVVLMRKIFQNSPLISKQIKPPKIAQTKLYLIQEEKIKPFQEPSTLKASETIAIFTTAHNKEKAKRWINNL